MDCQSTKGSSIVHGRSLQLSPSPMRSNYHVRIGLHSRNTTFHYLTVGPLQLGLLMYFNCTSLQATLLPMETLQPEINTALIGAYPGDDSPLHLHTTTFRHRLCIGLVVEGLLQQAPPPICPLCWNPGPHLFSATLCPLQP